MNVKEIFKDKKIETLGTFKINYNLMVDKITKKKESEKSRTEI